MLRANMLRQWCDNTIIRTDPIVHTETQRDKDTEAGVWGKDAGL